MTASTFGQYLAEWEARTEPWQRRDLEHCDECGEREPVTSDGMCRECLRYHYGYAQAQEQLVEQTVGGAVTGALEAGASP